MIDLEITYLNEHDKVANAQWGGRQFQMKTQLNLKEVRCNLVLTVGP